MVFSCFVQVKCGVSRPSTLSCSINNNHINSLHRKTSATHSQPPPAAATCTAETPALSAEEAALLAKLEEANR